MCFLLCAGFFWCLRNTLFKRFDMIFGVVEVVFLEICLEFGDVSRGLMFSSGDGVADFSHSLLFTLLSDPNPKKSVA